MSTILVTGATGTVGSHVVRELGRRPGVRVRALVRERERATAFLGDSLISGSAELVFGDYADRASLDRALAGAEAVFLSCANVPEQVEYETRMIDAARDAGVRRIVKLSAHGADHDSPVSFWRNHAEIEDYLVASGVPSTILRPMFSMANLLASARQVADQGALFLPADGARVAMVDPRDVAASAAAVLVAVDTSDSTNRLHVLTGPDIVTFDDVAFELAEVLEREVQFVSVPDTAASDGMVSAGVPAFVAAQFTSIFRLLREGIQARPTNGVWALTGREPKALSGFVRAYAGAFRPAYQPQGGGPSGARW